MSKRVPQLIGKKNLLEGKFLRFTLTTYIDTSGTIRDWESFERVNCKGIVVVVPIITEGETLLVRQFRPPVNNYVIEFPAGLSNRSESLEETAKRELLEETGYIAREIIYLTEGPVSSGASGEILTAFLARGLKFEGIGKKDETEDIEVIKVSLLELDSKLSGLRSEGNYIDLKIYGLVEIAKKFLSIH